VRRLLVAADDIGEAMTEAEKAVVEPLDADSDYVARVTEDVADELHDGPDGEWRHLAASEHEAHGCAIAEAINRIDMELSGRDGEG